MWKRVVSVGIVCSLIIQVSSIDIHASTTDDLRWVTGQDRLTSTKVVREIEEIQNKEYINESVKELESIIGENKYGGLKKEVKKLEQSVKKAKEDVKNGISSGDSVNNIMKKYRVYKEYKEELGVVSSDTSEDGDIEDVSRTEEMDEDRVKYVKELIKGMNDKYDIGDIGSSLEYVTRGVLKIKNMYGYTYKDTITKKKKYRDYIELCAGGEEKTIIQALWNGKVESVKTNKDTNIIRIKSGKTLYAEIEGVKGAEVDRGDKVKQYDNLGYIETGDTIKIRIILDGVTINPLRVYGSKGKKAYEEWYRENKEKVVEVYDMSNVNDLSDEEESSYEYGFYNVIEEEGEVENSKVTVEDGTEEDIHFNDNYEKPKNKIVE